MQLRVDTVVSDGRITAACRYHQPASRNQKGAAWRRWRVHFALNMASSRLPRWLSCRANHQAAMRHAYRVPAARFDPALPNVSQFDVRTNQGAYWRIPLAGRPRTSGLASIRMRRRWLTCIWMLTAEPETSPAMYKVPGKSSFFPVGTGPIAGHDRIR